MRLSTDQLIFWQYGFLKLNATIVYTWGLMLVLAVGAKLITRLCGSSAVPSYAPVLRWRDFISYRRATGERSCSDCSAFSSPEL